MKKFLLGIFLTIMSGCTSLPEIPQGTIEEKIDSTGSVVKIFTNYRVTINDSYSNGKVEIYNGTLKNDKFTGTKKLETSKYDERKIVSEETVKNDVILSTKVNEFLYSGFYYTGVITPKGFTGVRKYKTYDNKIVLEETSKNDKVIEKKYIDYETSDEEGRKNILNGVEKNGSFTGIKKKYYLKEINSSNNLVEITEEIKNNVVLSKIGKINKEFWEYNVFTKDVLLEKLDFEWYKEKRVGDIKEIEIQTLYVDMTEEFMNKIKLSSYQKNIIREIEKTGGVTESAYDGFGELLLVNFNANGHLKSPQKLKAKYNVKTGTFISFDYYFKGKKINTTNMSNSKKKQIYKEISEGQLKEIEAVENSIKIAQEKARIQQAIEQQRAAERFNATLNSLEQVTNAYKNHLLQQSKLRRIRDYQYY